MDQPTTRRLHASKGKEGAQGSLEGAHVRGDTGREVVDIASGEVLLVGELHRQDMAGVSLWV